MNFKISLTVISFEIFCFDSFAILINMILNYNKFELLLVINTFSFQTIKKKCASWLWLQELQILIIKRLNFGPLYTLMERNYQLYVGRRI